MAVTINASTSNGLIQTADTSGNINIQSNGTTVLATTSTGVAVTGTLSATSLPSPTITSPTISGAVMSSMASSVITSGTVQATTSGTNIDFTGIPSWAKRITVMYYGVSTNGTNLIQVQLGYGATPTYVTTGYLGGAGRQTTGIATGTVTTGIPVDATGGGYTASVRQGTTTLTLVDAATFKWVGTTILANSDANQVQYGSGSIALSNTLTAVRITTVGGTDTFDAGSINILYE